MDEANERANMELILELLEQGGHPDADWFRRLAAPDRRVR